MIIIIIYVRIIIITLFYNNNSPLDSYQMNDEVNFSSASLWCARSRA